MKKFLVTFICSILIIFTFFNYDKVSSFIADFISNNHTMVKQNINSYAKKDNFLFVQNVEDFTPYSYNDLINILYTGINNGWNTFTFYCAPEYEDCIKDIDDITNNNKVLLSHIDNFVHPYNSFTDLYAYFSNSGEITIEINRLYSDEEIKKVDSAADEFLEKYLDEEKSTYDNIKVLHDEIINNTKYDKDASKDGNSKYRSKTAYGVFFEGYATCNGYTDAMAILLSKMNVKNYKIATTPDANSNSEGHVWNAVYLDGKWLHLDLTWDDPVSDNNKDYLFHSYFLVSNEALKKADAGQVQLTVHDYDKLVYLEFKDNI